MIYVPRGHREQPLRLMGDRRKIAVLTGQGKSSDREQHLESRGTIRGHRSLCARGKRKIVLGRLERPPLELIRRDQRGKLRISGHGAYRESLEKLVLGCAVAVELKGEMVVGEHTSGQGPVPGSLCMADGLDRITVGCVPLSGQDM